MQSGLRKMGQDMNKNIGYNLQGKTPKIKIEGQKLSRSPNKPDRWGMNFPDTWGVKKRIPISTDIKPIQLQQKQEEIETEEETEEGKWSSEEWEDWALKMYEECPEARKYLPEWFNEEIESEEKD